MQVRGEESWPERNVYYLARGLSEQMQSGQDYGSLQPVLSVGFKEGLQLHIIELPKAERLGGWPPTLSAWISCLLHNLDEAVMSQIKHPPVQEALHRLQELSGDETLRWEAWQREFALLEERMLLNHATQKGVVQGREQGLEQGRQSAASTLHQLLQRKFGAVPPWAQDRIAAADLAALQRWTLNTLDADRIETLFSTEV